MLDPFTRHVVHEYAAKVREIIGCPEGPISLDRLREWGASHRSGARRARGHGSEGFSASARRP